ncbi:MAG: KpsF/GutQ family sugar-phosphate isomerase [Flavobacteriales bacterium]|jgi:arabinose-5-phosphate isomerase|nr:KpsF/GutQ family sugar-phosphate isomerase [Flavobacteriales bacterium]MBT6013278.1 KpsF/GutQ family sugar-phosphate isomerase [Flavobacteriales bacterium]MBT7480811.1 KpsF/GutQ family sugar-phosphate isomerase [Flavobacteriales bacterium]
MSNNKNILNIAKSVIIIEKNAISQLESQLTNDFVEAVQLIFSSKGRVIVAGVGKSANIANKMVATFNSTGQPAVFLHAADAIHGDLGNIQKDDVVICISKSGNTEEIKYLLPLIKDLGNKIISICGNSNSYLAKESNLFLDSTVEKEACPNNLAPTSSTTAQLVLGDALAVCLLKLNNFSDNDFARFHPGGSLGKRLFLKVSDLLSDFSKPIVSPTDSINSVIVEISNKRLGSTAVLENNKLIGIITDGDLRRMLEKNQNINVLQASDIMTENSKTINSTTLASDALYIMEQNNISQLIVMNGNIYCGIVHIHDILKEGI